MATEVERKYLVDTELWRPLGTGVLYRQGYLSSIKERVVRVRIVGEFGFLTVKGITSGISRLEFEYPIPREDAVIILDKLCERPLIEKTRHREVFAERTWEIDVFHGDNEGLVVAEIEVASPTDAIALPPWAGTEVSNDPRYFNSNLVAHPYKGWGSKRA
jgi:CYTH domain-containing protein